MGEFEELLNRMKTIRAKKNRDYGNSFIESYNDKDMGNHTIVFDIARKTGRIKNILLREKGKTQVEDETIEDTFIDLAIISLNCVIALRARKNKEEINGRDNKRYKDMHKVLALQKRNQ